jgi:hypothetical protein
MYINTNIHHKASAEEKKKVFSFCVENLKQLTTGIDSSWIIFEDKDGHTLSIAKPDSSAESSFFGDKFHFIQTYKNRLEELTADGLQLIGGRANV